jgi:hypothetical protein
LQWNALNRLGCRQAACGWVATATIAWLLCACASSGPAHSKAVLDESSGLSFIVVQRPMVFARARSDVAANARDYLTLVAAEEDRSGKYTRWLIVHRWSTVDPRMQHDPGQNPSQLRIIADDRELTLRRAEPDPAILARRDLLFAPHGSGAQSAAYPVDEATLRYIAFSRLLLLRVGDDTALPAYSVWADGRDALRSLLSEAAEP